MRRYGYVGPEQIRHAAVDDPPGVWIRDRADARTWVGQHLDDRDRRGEPVPATFVVTLEHGLRVASRRSEHVACASGMDVLAAGELFFAESGDVVAASNQSTGYCPDPSSWAALAAAIDAAGLARPAGFTTEIVFRRCPACGERNIVKDDNYVCAICDAELPVVWNFA